MSNRYNTTPYMMLLLFVDFIAITLVLFLWTLFFNINHEPFGAIQVAHIIVTAFIYQIILYSLGLYNNNLRESAFGTSYRIFLVSIIFYIVTFLILSSFESNNFLDNVLLPSTLSIFCYGLSIRVLIAKSDALNFTKRSVLVLGAGKRAEIILKRMRRKVDLSGFSKLYFVAMPGDNSQLFETIDTIKYPDNLSAFIKDNKIDEIVIANDERRKNLPVDELFECRINGVYISEILDFMERETGQVAVNLMYPSWVIYSNGFHSVSKIHHIFDWVFNSLLAIVLLLLTWPLMFITYLAIKLEDGWRSPGLYSQTRVGLNGKEFTIYKFRSMTLDAEKNGAVWANKTDVRVTKVGKIIRKYRLDELPQLYNVVNGDMSFVGPRPERPVFVEELAQKIPYYKQRHNVKSGLTGWAQLKYPYGSTDLDAEEKLKYDLYYLKHKSFFLDLLILIQTTEIIIFGKGR